MKEPMKFQKKSLLVPAVLFLILSCKESPDTTLAEKHDGESGRPKIVNIVNFIRLLEPRDANVTEDVLYQTVVQQIEMMKKYRLPGTFLLQYDALMDSRYQKLLKELPKDSFEIGAWWEIPQPMVEKAGLKWRGRFPWDWHADVGFATGYTPEEREKLADVYMADFKDIFGYYPKSVASWFIDAHTLNYLYEKYNIVASANCKDQYGTDGYTLWGGYWNQAYYPSKWNSYMPAQTQENQIPVPIFRMLGSDPVRQYDTALESNWQGVITLEPVYKDAGGDKEWVDWYFKEFVDGESMEYAYTQAGQENSFTWDAMQKGFEIQMPLIAQLRDENKLQVETLATSAEWFKDHYKITPATSVTVTTDLKDGNRKTVWFNSRFYRANLLWEDGTLRFRDIHLFDEHLKSNYLTERVDSNQAKFFTLPFVDGYLWSTFEQLAGLRFNMVRDGNVIPLMVEYMVVSSPETGVLQILCPLESMPGNLAIRLDEKNVEIKVEGEASKMDWFLDLTVSKMEQSPFEKIQGNQVNCFFQGINYTVTSLKGGFSVPNDDVIFRVVPENNTIELNFNARE